MSTPTRYQPWRIPILQGRVGYAEPAEPDPDPADPIDYAAADEAGAAFIPYQIGGGAVTIVNDYHTYDAVTDPDWSGDFTPTAGNVVLVFVYQRSSNIASAPTGWTRLEVLQFVFDSISCYGKVSDGTETTMSYNPGTSDQRDYVVLEISGITLADVATNTATGSSTSVATGSVTPTASVPAIIFGAAAATTDEVGGHSFTPGAGWTEIFDTPGTAHPFGTLYYQIVNPASGSYNPPTTLNALAGGDSWGGITVALSADSQILWQTAPAVIDGDDATYATALVADTDGEMLRSALEVARLIYRAEVRLGTENSGSRTYELYGTNDPSHVDPPDLLASVTFTATGSFTAQEIVFAWVPAASYQYYRLFVDTVEDIRWYDLNLYSAVDTIGVSDHPLLTGRDTVDSHPADAVTVTPFDTIAATDVQAALEEIFAEAGGSTLTVEDGVTSVSPVDTIVFDGATVTDDTGGQVTVTVTGGGGGSAGVFGEAERTAGDITTSSTSFIDATGMSVTVTTGANRCLILVLATGYNSGANTTALDVAIDGTRQGQTLGMTLANGSDPSSIAFSFVSDALTAGSHTFKIQWLVSGGTGTLFASTSVAPLKLQVQEIAGTSLSLAREFDYAQATSPVTVSATTEATANTVVTGNAVTYDGSTTVMVEGYVPYIDYTGGGAQVVWLVLYDGSSSIGRWSVEQPVTGSTIAPVHHVSRRLTPSAAAHTYSLRAYVNTSSAVAGMGAGGSGNYVPAFIRITEVVGAGGGGSGVTVEDEGTPLATTATTLDFVGAGVTASGTGATKTITIAGGGEMTLVAEFNLGSDAADFDFTSIPGTYRHLRLDVWGRGTASSSFVVVRMEVNGDTGANYDYVTLAAAGTGASVASGYGSTFAQVAQMTAATASANFASMQTLNFPFYADTSFHKQWAASGWLWYTTGQLESWNGNWRSTAAITRVRLYPASGNFLAGSRATLYGIT